MKGIMLARVLSALRLLLHSIMHFYQLALANCVKELFQIHVHYIDIAFVGIFLAGFQGIMCSAPWPEAKACV